MEATSTGKHRIFLTGATGSMGISICRALIEAGHRVVGTVRSSDRVNQLKSIGAEPAEVDLLAGSGLSEAMKNCDVIAHFATSIPRGFAATRLDAWRSNDALRRHGTRRLIEAAEANGIRRFLFESIALAYPGQGDSWIDESVALERISPVMGTAIEAEGLLREFGERGGEPVALRFGRLYGPGRASADFIEAMQKRQMPVVGPGDNYVSSIHVADVGSAVLNALNARPGVYNIVDDEPLSQRELLATVATCLEAPPPRRIPGLVARMMMRHIAPVLTVSQRVSNRLFRKETGWTPDHSTAVSGWRATAAASSEPQTVAS